MDKKQFLTILNDILRYKGLYKILGLKLLLLLKK